MGDHETTFSYDEEPLEQGRYREWFWAGLQPDQLAYLRTPARVDKPTPEPVIYDAWESEQPRHWQHEAACAGADPKIFFDESHYPRRAYLKPDAEWRSYCPQCPVRETCLEAARDSDSVGIFGGVFRTFSNSKTIEEVDDRIRTTRARKPFSHRQLSSLR